jgi:uncharacterized membrane protein YdjX (TVP38/TMEM64 family)
MQQCDLKMKAKRHKIPAKYKFFILICLIAIFIGVSFLFNLHKKISIEQIRIFIKSLGFFGPLVYMMLYSVTSIILFPASLLSIASGTIWGPYLGTAYTVTGATLSASIPFFIARLLGRDYVQKKLSFTNKLRICDKFLKKNGFMAVFIMRLIPLFPWDVVNYGSGICGIRLRDYLSATFIGIIPGSFTYNLIGSTIGKPLNITKIVIIFVIVIVLATITFIVKKKFFKNYDK